MIFKTFENLTHRQVILRLNSGKTLFIPPGKLSDPLPVEEVSDNTTVDKLLDRRIIAMHPAKAKTPAIANAPVKANAPKPSAAPAKPAKTKKTTKTKSKGGR